MRNPRLFCPTPLSTGALVDLPEQTSHYISKVLRMNEGNAVRLFNGEGGYYEAEIHALSKKKVSVALGAFHPENKGSPLAVHLGIALSKGDKMDWIVQKATELGASEITPLTSLRSDVKIPKERQEKRIEHWRQVAISACEQCERNLVPLIHPIQSLEQWTANSQAELKLILHHRAQALDNSIELKSAALLIGPEGGLNEQEIEQAENKGFVALTLGPRVMRTETAPIAALSVLQYLWGDLS
jgi:16S rRNA (uracil1498-N3)-methyltransferase